MTHNTISLVVSDTPFPGSSKVMATDGLGGVSVCYTGSPAYARLLEQESAKECAGNTVFTADRLSNLQLRERLG